MGETAMVKHLGAMAVLWAITAAVWADEPLIDNGLTAEEKIRQGWGIGVIIGEPTGLSAKKWVTDTTAIDAAAAWSFVDFNSFQLHVDYLWHNYDLIKTKELAGQLAVFYGVGGRIKLKGSSNGNKDEDARLGMRLPVGLSYTFKETPVELFAEVVPLLDVAPETEPGIEIGFGARYYFKLQ